MFDRSLKVYPCKVPERLIHNLNHKKDTKTAEPQLFESILALDSIRFRFIAV